MLVVAGPFSDFLKQLNLIGTIANLEKQLYQFCVPLELDNSQKHYYTTTTATFLMAFADMGFISKEDLPQFQQALIFLRDHSVIDHQIAKPKNQEDKVAWCVTEGPSIWATSMALWALISTGYKGNQLDSLRGAIGWLREQQKQDLGWGFQNIDSCRSSTFLTAIVIRVFQLALKHGYIKPTYREDFVRVIQSGLSFLISNVSIHENFAAWAAYPNSNIFSPTCTAYAIWVLQAWGGDSNKEIIKKGISFTESRLQGEKGWSKDVILEEYKTKEGLQKHVISFTPAIVILLLNIGISPKAPVIIQAIRNNLIIRKGDGWGVGGEDTYTFSTVLAIWTIYRWWKSLGLKQAVETLGLEHKSTQIKNRFCYINRRQFLALLVATYISINSIYLWVIILLFGKSIWGYICKPSISELSSFALSISMLLVMPVTFFYIFRVFYTYGQIQPLTFINLIKQKIKLLNIFRNQRGKLNV